MRKEEERGRKNKSNKLMKDQTNGRKKREKEETKEVDRGRSSLLLKSFMELSVIYKVKWGIYFNSSPIGWRKHIMSG